MRCERTIPLFCGALECLLGVGLSVPALAAQEAVVASEGMVAYQSDAGFAATLGRIEPAVTERGLFVMRVLDHAASAAQLGIELSPNSVVLFGNPKIGAEWMRCAPRMGIDLPQKLLVWEESGVTYVAYNDPEYLAQRHAASGCEELLVRVGETLDGIARQVAGSD